MRNVRVFEVNLRGTLAGIFAKSSLSRKSETRIARRMRQELKEVLRKTVIDARRDGGAPMRTGRSFAIMRNGVRSFGTSFNTLRGHIIGPGYIKAHEEGATIRPKNAKALAIPLPAALRPDGTPKLPGPRSWQNVAKTFIYKSKKTGRAYIAYKGASGRLTLLYVFVEEAHIRERRFLRKAWSRNKGDLMQTFGRLLMAEMASVDLGKLAKIKTSR